MPADDRTGFVSQLIYIQGEETHRFYSQFSLSDRAGLCLCDIYIHYHRLTELKFFHVISALENNEQKGVYFVGTFNGFIKGLSDILKRKDGMQRGDSCSGPKDVWQQ